MDTKLRKVSLGEGEGKPRDINTQYGTVSLSYSTYKESGIENRVPYILVVLDENKDIKDCLHDLNFELCEVSYGGALFIAPILTCLGAITLANNLAIFKDDTVYYAVTYESERMQAIATPGTIFDNGTFFIALQESPLKRPYHYLKRWNY